MGAGTSPVDGSGSAEESGAPAEREAEARAGASGTAGAGASVSGAAGAGAAEVAPAVSGTSGTGVTRTGATAAGASATVSGATVSGATVSGEGRTGEPAPAPATPGTDPAAAARARRFSLTRDTARPEGGGRAAGGDAPAPARQWPLLAVLCMAGIGLLIVAADPFEEAFRVGTILIGVALVAGAVLRLVVRSVGMLAVRSRFTDLVTYGLLGTLIVLLALVAQPQPWLDIPFLEDAVHFTVR
ncbi:DUF3017 domain-containing protein [Streptomyces sp. NPDC019224]|uniref:DUF3017 domain-containing protein n=1 Tax=Streptomyces sp. NPDC019224 TaxID=3154484 RepID=UPI0034052C87